MMKDFFYIMSSGFSWVTNGGKKIEKEGRSNRTLFPHHTFFFHSFFFIVAWITIFEHFITSLIRIFRLVKKKKSKFKTEETGVMEYPLAQQAFSFHFTNLGHCCESLLASICFEHRTRDCCCWEMFLQGWTKFQCVPNFNEMKF